MPDKSKKIHYVNNLLPSLIGLTNVIFFQGVVRSSFLNQGEICLCTSRIFVQEVSYEKL